MRLIDFVSLNLRLKDLLGPVTRVQKKKKNKVDRVLPEKAFGGHVPPGLFKV